MNYREKVKLSSFHAYGIMLKHCRGKGIGKYLMLATEYYCKTLGKRNQTIVKFSVVNPEPVGSGTYFRGFGSGIIFFRIQIRQK